ncbi:ATP-binding cassette domain-containing protein [Methylocapsa sp. S129]|uniref:ATP-binding cassette domain-containing protein n=1 Tax=Methylocapsa sp. S129 TaxID=1641869 RepID=UPI00131AC60E|nr:ATP-binding cassette domain-containing protein [Methylocapsa sp. S129]
MSSQAQLFQDASFASSQQLRAPDIEEARTASSARSGLAIELRSVSKAFGPREVLKGLDLTIRPGEFVVVVGRSGGGKSTLLRLVAGLERPSAGAIAIDNQPVAGLQGAARMMFQDARLLPWQSVIANVGIARGPEWRARALEALAAVGLADRANDWPRILSGGQRQRVALARALVSRPSVLLLDEPFGALDALTRVEMHRLLESLWREYGFTALLITHDVAEAVALGDRVLALREGAIALDLPIPHKRQQRDASDAELAALQARVLAAV